MTTTKRILSGLALTAATLVIVPVSSDEAAAKGGMSGAHSVAVVRTTPMVITKYRAATTPCVRKLTYSTAKISKLSQTGDKKNTQDGDKLKNAKLANKSPHATTCIHPLATPGSGPCPVPGGDGKEKPPVIIVDRPHPVVGIGVAPAPVVVEPAGCIYERSVRKLPGGGLQRVIVKMCPDA